MHSCLCLYMYIKNVYVCENVYVCVRVCAHEISFLSLRFCSSVFGRPRFLVSIDSFQCYAKYTLFVQTFIEMYVNVWG